MRARIWKHLITGLLAVAFGAFSGLAYPRFDIWPMIFVSVAGITWLAKDRSLRASAALGLLSGLGFYTAQIYWISQYLGPIPLVALSLLQAAIFVLGFLALTIIWRLSLVWQASRVSWLVTSILLSAVWVAREWLSTHWPYGGFPWSRLAMSQSASPLAKYAFLGGLPLLGFVVALLSAIAMHAVMARTSRKAPVQRATALWGCGLAVLLILAPCLLQLPTAAEHGSIKIAAVQGNANAGLFANSTPGSIFEKHLRASSLLDAKGLPESSKPDVVIWPENAADSNPLNDATAAVELNDFVNTLDRPLIFGTITQSGNRYYNSSLLWLPNKGLTQQYDKKRPVPFAEYVPDRKFWQGLAPDLIGLIWHDYSFGTRKGVFDLKAGPVGVNICFEIAVDELNRDLVTDGAQVIVSQTNNSDFGHSDETYQQVAIARLRAIETGRAVVNDSTVGVTAAFLPDGSVVDQLPAFKPGMLRVTLPLRTSKTPAYYIAPAFDASCIILVLGALGVYAYLFVRNRKQGRGVQP
jgi:apolipoprotein N-acyltransferase